ncbi:MAG TPA: nicotinate-nucleotide adenylyltransferase [Gammaproteobacteria bacterium]|nr:nicotinate-nucleotide adenylyltransferase [Gammaproteobacteria bacterium]
MRKIGIFGGSFDPIHFGHLRPALEILDVLSLDEIRFIPAGQPPHRQAPAAAASLRLQMVKAAVAMEPRFLVDEREIKRSAPSYSVDTLAELRRELPSDALALLVGMDAFLGFPGWHQWRMIFDYAHVIVAHRPGWVLQSGGELVDLIHQRQAMSAPELWSTKAGRILLQPVTQLEISSTLVRASIAAGGDPRYLVPETVRELILNSHCYMQPTVH